MKIMKHIEHVQFIVVFFHVSENFRYVILYTSGVSVFVFVLTQKT